MIFTTLREKGRHDTARRFREGTDGRGSRFCSLQQQHVRRRSLTNPHGSTRENRLAEGSISGLEKLNRSTGSGRPTIEARMACATPILSLSAILQYGGLLKGRRQLSFPIGVGGVLGDVMVRRSRGTEKIVQLLAAQSRRAWRRAGQGAFGYLGQPEAELSRRRMARRSSGHIRAVAVRRTTQVRLLQRNEACAVGDTRPTRKDAARHRRRVLHQKRLIGARFYLADC